MIEIKSDKECHTCRNLIPLIAEVAKTCPLLPTDKTTIEAVTTIKSKIYICTSETRLLKTSDVNA